MSARCGVLLVVGLVLLSVSLGLSATLRVPSVEYPTIQSAIGAANNGDTVQVAAGTYYESLTWESKSIALVGVGAGVTIVSGDTDEDGSPGPGRCLTMANVPDTARVEGFTFTGGSAGSGGGLALVYSSPTLANNTISGNSAEYGGGLRLDYSSAVLVNNTITGNAASRVGGGLAVFCSSPALVYNTISRNSAQLHGGGLWVNISSATLTSNTISGNSAGGGVGGVGLYHASPTFANNTITGNYGGGLDACYYSSPTLTNNTIAANTGYGLFNHGDPAGFPYAVGTPIITNCVLWGNSGYDLAGASGTHSDIGTGEVAGEGNISADPMFVDPSAGDYHLQDGSPCIDVGSNDAPSLPQTDKDGNQRIVGSLVDMGAYEWQGPSVIAAAIDIKPGSYPNSINLGSRGTVPVAILSDGGFDATSVDPSQVYLAGAYVAIRGKGALMANQEDVDGDGLLDLVVHVDTENLSTDEIQDGYAYLLGFTYDGLEIEGCDEITIVPPE